MTFDVKKSFGAVKWTGKDPKKQPLYVAELALWSAMSDGELAGEEVEAIAATISQIPALSDFTTTTAIEMIEKMADTYTDGDAIAKRIVELALGITEPDLRRTCYKLAVLTASTDGEFSDEETDFLQGLQETWRISDEEAEKLVQEVFSG